MALNGVVLGDAILAAIDAAAAANQAVSPAQRAAIWRAIGTAIVVHIQSQGTVVVTSVTGVTAGAGVSGPGAGTIL
jgi:hypothetical protein